MYVGSVGSSMDKDSKGLPTAKGPASHDDLPNMPTDTTTMPMKVSMSDSRLDSGGESFEEVYSKVPPPCAPT